MIQDLTISYVEGGIETTMTVKDDYYGNVHYMLAEIFENVIRASDANPKIVIEKMKSAFEYEQKEILLRIYRASAIQVLRVWKDNARANTAFLQRTIQKIQIEFFEE